MSSDLADPNLASPLEAASRSEVNAHQNRALAEAVRWIGSRSPYWQARFSEHGTSAEAILTTDDLYAAPTLTKKHYMDALQAQPPYGGFLCQDLNAVLREGAIVYRTTGTSGMQGSFINTHEGFQLFGDEYARPVWEAGARPGDFVMVGFPLALWAAGWGLYYACRRIGANFLPAGAPADTLSRLRLLQDYRPTVVVFTPSYAVTLGRAARDEGINLADLGLKGLVLTGEIYPPKKRELIEDLWGAEGRTRNAYGISEGGPLMAGFECSEQDGLHLVEDRAVHQFWQPGGDSPAKEGELAEYVFTNLDQRVMATWFNFRTRDGAIYSDEPCRCGRKSRRMWVKERLDDMVKIKGVNIFASGVEDVLRRIPGIGDEFRLVIERVDEHDRVTLEFEREPTAEEDAQKLAAVAGKELRSVLGINLILSPLEFGSLPRTELKARRWDDRRPKDQ